MEMNKKFLLVTVASLVMASAGAAIACEYKAGETKFLDYANCRYGEDALQVVVLPKGPGWEKCIYLMEAFRPPKLLAVTKMKGDKEEASISNRSQIGNPCYLNKQSCDAALKAAEQ
jgi:hypothetical protein